MTSPQPGSASTTPSLTVVMPVYNEESCLREAVEEVRRHVLALVPGSELLVVNDGSTDRSGEMLDEMAAELPNLSVLHKRNGGHGEALVEGMNAAHGEYLFLIDSDRQIPLEQFAAHWRLRDPGALLCGVRTNRRDPFHRMVLTRVLRLSLMMIFGRRLRDSNAPYKIVPRGCWDEARRVIPPNALTPSLLLAVVASRSPAMRLLEVPVPHLPRRTGSTVLVPWRLVRLCLKAGVQLVDLRRRV